MGFLNSPWDFFSLLPWFHILLNCESSLSGTVCRRESRTQFMIKLPVFKEKKHSYLHNNYVCWGCASSQNLPLVFGTNLTCLPIPRFARIPSNIQKYFLNLWSVMIFFTSGKGPDILIIVLEDCIVFLIYLGSLSFV